jgi:2-dehydropantoate 2-reductase
MRYVIYGAGAVGGTIGGRLHEAGREVVLIARGEHLRALRDDGLRLRSPDEDRVLAVPAAGSPGEAAVRDGDVVILCTKTQDSEAALGQLAAVAPPSVAVVTAQNGVENERLALRRFARVHAMLVYLPAEHLAPGVVAHACAPAAGVLDLGPYPAGTGDPDGHRQAEAIAADLEAAGFASRPVATIVEWKHRKLLSNLRNAIEAAVGPDAGDEVYEQARAEALACYAAAGIAIPSDAEEAERREAMSPPRPVAGLERGGGSSWQSLARGAGRIEADWLNGEIALLGRSHGVATPVNVALQRLANRLARERRPPGSLSEAELAAAVRA